MLKFERNAVAVLLDGAIRNKGVAVKSVKFPTDIPLGRLLHIVFQIQLVILAVNRRINETSIIGRKDLAENATDAAIGHRPNLRLVRSVQRVWVAYIALLLRAVHNVQLVLTVVVEIDQPSARQAENRLVATVHAAAARLSLCSDILLALLVVHAIQGRLVVCAAPPS